MEKFYIFGLQRSGTTFLENLITLNFDVSVANSEGTWKHLLKVPEKLENHKVFCIFKNPYTWLESIIFRDPADILVTAKEYDLTNSGYIIGHDSVNLYELCRLYNNYVLNWSNSQAELVRYEDLLDEQKLQQFLNSLPFCRKTSTYQIPEPGSLFMSEGFSKTSYSYYLDGLPKRFNETELSIINNIINKDELKKLGYKL